MRSAIAPLNTTATPVSLKPKCCPNMLARKLHDPFTRSRFGCMAAMIIAETDSDPVAVAHFRFALLAVAQLVETLKIGARQSQLTKIFGMLYRKIG